MGISVTEQCRAVKTRTARWPNLLHSCSGNCILPLCYLCAFPQLSRSTHVTLSTACSHMHGVLREHRCGQAGPAQARKPPQSLIR